VAATTPVAIDPAGLARAGSGKSVPVVSGGPYAERVFVCCGCGGGWDGGVNGREPGYGCGVWRGTDCVRDLDRERVVLLVCLLWECWEEAGQD